MTKVNDYDTYAEFRQKELRSDKKLSHRFVEKPAMSKLLPDLKTKKVLLLGCGTGEEIEILEAKGATDITGIDISKVSIKLAQEMYPRHTFIVRDMHNLAFQSKTFDFVYSSLAIHYSQYPGMVYKEVFRVLKSGGQFQFSVVHPLRGGVVDSDIAGIPSKIVGYSTGENITSYGSYMSFHEQEESFSSGEILRFWCGPPSLHFNLLLSVGFEVENFIETQALEECEEVNKAYYQRYREFPQFAVFLAKKSKSKS